ncbi:MAG: glycine cleavage system protein GcvH [Alphaproteobacteria bacterium]|jgi:glycine cleavage system H protein
MAEIRYTKTHQWIRRDGDAYTVGITDYAQEQLGNVIYVSLPAVGRRYKQQDEAAVVESMKVASDVYMPVAGEITEINMELNTEPSLVNADPEGRGWFFKVKPSSPEQFDDLMDEAAYKASLA